MIFRKKTVSSWVKKIDKVVTWLIIGTAVASMIWVSRTKKWKKVTENIKDAWRWAFDKWLNIFWKVVVWTVNFFKKK